MNIEYVYQNENETNAKGLEYGYNHIFTASPPPHMLPSYSALFSMKHDILNSFIRSLEL